MSQLTVIQNLTPAEIYESEKVDFILSKISEEAKSFESDMSTPAGRKELASLAYKIAQSKTFMDECGKKLGEDAKKKLDKINAERKKIRDTLDVLKEQIRQPLTDWEKQDEARKHQHKLRLDAITISSRELAEKWKDTSVDDFNNALAICERDHALNWEEFKEDADTLITAAVERLTTARDSKIAHDEQQKELERLRAEKEEREKIEAARIEKEREETRLQAEAEAKKQAEEKAKKDEAEREAKRIEREKQLAFEKEQAILKEKEDADRRVKETEAKAAREKEAAIEKERQRQYNEHLRQEEEKRKREANLKHRTKINNEALNALKANGYTEEQGKNIITLVASGHIPHMRITY